MSTLRVLRIAQLLVGFGVYALNEAVRKQTQVANGEVVIPVGDDTTIIIDNAARIAGAEVVSDKDLYDLACIAAGTEVVRDNNELETALQVVSTIDDDSFESVYEQAQNWLVTYRLAKQTDAVAVDQPQPEQPTNLIAAPAAEENNMDQADIFGLSQEEKELFKLAADGDIAAREKISLPIFAALIAAAKLEMPPLASELPPEMAVVEKVCKEAHENLRFMLADTQPVDSLVNQTRETALVTLPRLRVVGNIIKSLGKTLMTSFTNDEGVVNEDVVRQYAQSFSNEMRGMLCAMLVSAFIGANSFI